MIFYVTDTLKVSVTSFEIKSIKYFSIKYLSQDNKLIMNLLDIVKTAILYT